MSFGAVTQPKKSIKFAIQGPTGAGKTHWGLAILTGLSGTAPIAMLDTESERGKLFAKRFKFEYDMLTTFSPNHYVVSIAEACGLTLEWPLPAFSKTTFDAIPDLIREAQLPPFGGLLIDSLTHAWDSIDGVLDQVNRTNGNTFTDGWGKVGTPLQNRLMQSIIKAPIHIGCTIRTKMDYAMIETTNKQGNKVSAPQRVGLAPVQRDNTGYEFDYIFTVDMFHVLTVEKCPPIEGLSGAQYMPTAEDLALLIATITNWTNEGTVAVETRSQAQTRLTHELIPKHYATADAIVLAMRAIPDFPKFSVERYTEIKGLLVAYAADRVAELAVEEEELDKVDALIAGAAAAEAVAEVAALAPVAAVVKKVAAVAPTKKAVVKPAAVPA